MPKKRKSKLTKRPDRQRSETTKLTIELVLTAFGLLFLTVGLLLLAVIFHSALSAELAYRLFPPNKNAPVMTATEQHALVASRGVIRPVDEDYGIVIPKIGANAKVIPGVSPFNEKEYQIKLTKGVAQARDTANPGEFGNTFIFAHSAGTLSLANQYNAVFYLLNKMEKNDKIYLFYKGKKYLYKVNEVAIVSADALSYLKQDNTKHELTLMTCWPPGTTLKRLIVRAVLAQ